MRAPMDDTASLGDARAWLRLQTAKGAECPCCRQLVKVYRRKLNSSMARALIHFYRNAGQGYFHADRLMKGRQGSRGDYVKLAGWDLIEPRKDDETEKKHSGWWRLTLAGIDFVMCLRRVPSHSIIYNGRVLRLEGEPTDIEQALGRHFDYRELMAERPRSGEPE